jgi:hypothetical protein
MQQTFDVYDYNFPKCDIQNVDLKEVAFKHTKNTVVSIIIISLPVLQLL